MRKYKKPASSTDHPIYYSVQPDYSQDAYMDVCSLLPTNNLNAGTKTNSKNHNVNISSTSCNSSISTTNENNKSSTQSSSSSSSSPIVSPTDTLKFLNSNTLMSNIDTKNFNKNFNSSVKANEYEIIKLIQEQQQDYLNNKKLENNFNISRAHYENSDLYTFSIRNNGGLIEVPKYGK